MDSAARGGSGKEHFPDTCQSRFARRWADLSDQHVRSLAWLLDSPDLLDPAAPQWHGKIATLSLDANRIAAWLHDWLTELDRQPEPLHAWLQARPTPRLGRYAENLAAFYFREQGILAEQGLQVREAGGETIGEFDFLLRQGQGLAHLELATKFYLLPREAESAGDAEQTEYFIGPDPSDRLGSKIDKMLDKQLALAAHPVARGSLSAPVVSAQALIKGWLFYHPDAARRPTPAGVSPDHCRGFWCGLPELKRHLRGPCAILPRLNWLAPALGAQGDALAADALVALLEKCFESQSTPQLIAVFAERDGRMVEVERGFVVPESWREISGIGG